MELLLCGTSAPRNFRQGRLSPLEAMEQVPPNWQIQRTFGGPSRSLPPFSSLPLPFSLPFPLVRREAVLKCNYRVWGAL